MKIQTFSIVAGSEACNARCPFCISKMTPPMGVAFKEPAVNWRNFRKACQLAKACDVITAMITSKGEPTLFPKQISKYLRAIEKFEFPIIEIQTNGIPIAERPTIYDKYLAEWYELGLTTLAISIVHWEAEKNRQVYLPHKKEYINLSDLIRKLHLVGFSVRLACIMADGFVCSKLDLNELISFALQHQVEQLTIRPVNKPENPRNQEAFDWTQQHWLKEEQLKDIEGFLETEGAQIMQLVHGARIFDVRGQNVCLTRSLTIDPQSEDIRQLIFFPDGHLRYDWQYSGAILI